MKPVLKPKLGEGAAMFRARRAMSALGLIAVKRRCALGPLFVVDLRSGRVIDRHVASYRALAAKYEKLHGERTS
jgi:hypothetical protein